MLVVELECDGTRLISRCSDWYYFSNPVALYFHRSCPIAVSPVSSTGRERELPTVSSKYLLLGRVPLALRAASMRVTLYITWVSINDGGLSLAP